MADHGRRRYIVCYDIADPKRLKRVHRRAKEDGMALQYSVFECWLSHSQLQRLMRDVRGLIDDRQDDVRIYGILARASITTIGRKTLPEGVLSINTGASD